MTITLNDKIVWITGASGGIGEALAKTMAQEGAIVVLSARRHAELERVRLTLPNPDKHMTLPLDICIETAQEQALAAVLARYGKIDMLVNNAGISQRALIMDTTGETDRKIMEIDYFAQVALSRRVLSSMLKYNQGQLVFISSVAGLVGTQYRGSYSAAKAALHLWANSARAELYEQGIRVAVVFPGFVKTAVSMNALTGSGEALGKMDDAQANAMTATEFAVATVKALKAGKSYIVIGGFKEKLAALLGRFAPELLYKMIRKSKVR
ncbi:SDR family NAD(P)-dependent oxidoreductase [Alishewanella tabrizica]|uniref:Oxidoreductase n=1 Tax=Alishewanella tabrizica TaxID=671278 RepID=A0ABQ2WEK9_9ALTE|nr:SDR family NAD(P)-dependent oxidoreductase [Alishewanella tabrizica]GGW48830.1 oxidoreductase [Alishewanella tabrizica]